MEEAQSRYRKQVKALEGEKRAAIKKAKGSKGKKAKEALQDLEEEYAVKLQEMEQRHQEEVAAIQKEFGTDETTAGVVVVVDNDDGQAPDPDTAEKEMMERKREKARRKLEQKLEQQRQRQEEQERDLAGPSARKRELELLQEQLGPLQLKIVPVASDGHCLYRAVSEQCDQSYLELRQLCATTLSQHEEDFSPFIEFTEEAPTFSRYVERIRHSADWGGHVELRVLSLALKRPVIVYSALPPSPLSIPFDEKGCEQEEPIRLSYHLHYYSLGEHYNCVVSKNDDDDEHECL